MKRYTKAKPPEVGDIWEDADPRNPGRRIRIEAIQEDPVDPKRSRSRCVNVDTGKVTYVQVSRFKPTRTGYRFVGRAKR